MKKSVFTATMIPVVFFIACSAAFADGGKRDENFSIKPVILDAKDAAKTVVGIEYNLEGILLEKKFTATDSGSDVIDPDAPIGGLKMEYKLGGTIASDKELNPKNLLESRLSGSYFRSSSLTAKAGFFVKYENSQSFDDAQSVYGVSATAGKIDFLKQNGMIALDVDLGEVDPINDKEREAIVGSDLDAYYRWDLEVLYIYPLGISKLETLEINYRYFQELSAPDAIKDAGLDTFKLVTYRLGFQNNLYIAYSRGTLPFDRQSDRIYEIGFSYKLW